MDIKFEAPGRKNQEMTEEYYSDALTAKFGQYDFVKSIDVKLKREKEENCVSLQIKPEKGTALFVSHTDKNENKALQEAIRKMGVKIEKYKEKHYHDAHLFNKRNRS